MSRASRAVLGVLVAAAAPVTAQDDEKRITGTVVDAEGAPVAGATVATMWRFGPRPEPSSGEGRTTQTDARGRFEGLFRVRWNAVTLVTYSRDRGLAALLRLDPEHPGEDVRIELHPSVRVRARFSCKELGQDSVEPFNYVYMQAEPRRLMLGASHPAGGLFEALLPRGAYDLNAYGRDMYRIYHPFDVPADRAEVDLGTLDIPASFFALHRGKALPEWNVTAARGVPAAAASLASFRGKWLLVEFWGFW